MEGAEADVPKKVNSNNVLSAFAYPGLWLIFPICLNALIAVKPTCKPWLAVIGSLPEFSSEA